MARKKANKLTAESLKTTLWETMEQLASYQMGPNQANAIASQAREILRATNIQIQTSKLSNTPVPKSVKKFTED